MSPSSRYVTLQEIGQAVGAVVGELWARAEAIEILRRLEVEPGPDPVQQVVDLARDVAQLVGAEPS